MHGGLNKHNFCAVEANETMEINMYLSNLCDLVRKLMKLCI